MGVFKLIPAICLKDGKVTSKTSNNEIIEGVSPVELAVQYANNGVDEIMIIDKSDTEVGRDANIRTMITVTDTVDVPILVEGKIDSYDDIKKYLYTGAKKVILDGSKESNLEMVSLAAERFGSNKIAVKIDKSFEFENVKKLKYDGASLIVADDCAEKILGYGVKILSFNGTNSFDDIVNFSENDKIYGVCHDHFDVDFDYMDFKHQLKEQGVNVSVFESKIPFSQFKLNSDGMVPVIVQDYKTDKILMLAYMNEQAYNMTIETGKMTYYSRSRDEIWVKGLTSGHIQYVKELKIDCDLDTILAKVYQVGVPCHTGAETCFFNELVASEYDNSNPIKIFEEVYTTILDRKANPKDGSYTNYLMDKGLDKILKKINEESMDIIVAAKNGDNQETISEISDLLYHTMVLMATKGISWKDIIKDLSRR